jgi:CheY-like chemotaxis protein
MSLKRALVVNDSKSARLALKRLLEKHDLAVDFAATGEAALEFLKDQPVDVIFMDHAMPGMDGLQAVSAIKKDPRTAMIPVMMYTAREGEVYVGQARALGAVGVLPKQVQPAALFQVLLKLGLVKDRRANGAPQGAASGLPPGALDAEHPDQAHDSGAQGVALQTLLTRMLEDQHAELRAEILNSHREFATHVAEEIYEKQRHDDTLAGFELEQPRTYSLGAMIALGLLVLLPGLIFLVLYLQASGQRDAALTENARLATMTRQQLSDVESERSGLLSDIDAERRRADVQYLRFLEALEWAVNQDNAYPYEEIALNDARLEKLRELLTRLAALGFQGTVRLQAHLGEFCLVGDDAGGYRLAEPDTLIEDCAFIGHPLDASSSVSERQSVSFANFLATSPLVDDAGIAVQIIALDRAGSERRYPYPANVRSAGEWNQIAELNNRVEYSLFPAMR